MRLRGSCRCGLPPPTSRVEGLHSSVPVGRRSRPGAVFRLTPMNDRTTTETRPSASLRAPGLGAAHPDHSALVLQVGQWSIHSRQNSIDSRGVMQTSMTAGPRATVIMRGAAAAWFALRDVLSDAPRTACAHHRIAQFKRRGVLVLQGWNFARAWRHPPAAGS